MNTQTKIRLQIFITHVEILATHVLDTKSSEYQELCQAAFELKETLDKDETILEVR